MMSKPFSLAEANLMSKLYDIKLLFIELCIPMFYSGCDTERVSHNILSKGEDGLYSSYSFFP